MTTWIAWLLAFPAFAALSLAMDAHHERVLGTTVLPRAQWLWRSAGVALLLASLAICWRHWSASVAVAAWLGVLTLAALAVVLLLTYAAPRLRWLAGWSLLLGALGCWWL